VHVDHLTIADAIRRVAFLINVPQAFTPEFPDLPQPMDFVKKPVILNVYDGYMTGGNSFDLAVNIDETFEAVAEMSWCHQSQIREWLPWVGGEAERAPEDFKEWKTLLYERFRKQNRDAGVESDHLYELFTLTGWGACPASVDQDFPKVDPAVSRLEALKEKIARMRD